MHTRVVKKKKREVNRIAKKRLNSPIEFGVFGPAILFYFIFFIFCSIHCWLVQNLLIYISF